MQQLTIYAYVYTKLKKPHYYFPQQYERMQFENCSTFFRENFKRMKTEIKIRAAKSSSLLQKQKKKLIKILKKSNMSKVECKLQATVSFIEMPERK